jgi:hypothetical protein
MAQGSRRTVVGVADTARHESSPSSSRTSRIPSNSLTIESNVTRRLPPGQTVALNTHITARHDCPRRENIINLVFTVMNIPNSITCSRDVVVLGLIPDRRKRYFFSPCYKTGFKFTRYGGTGGGGGGGGGEVPFILFWG